MSGFCSLVTYPKHQLLIKHNWYLNRKQLQSFYTSKTIVSIYGIFVTFIPQISLNIFIWVGIISDDVYTNLLCSQRENGSDCLTHFKVYPLVVVEYLWILEECGEFGL